MALNDRKLCGFLPAVLSASSPQKPREYRASPPTTLAPGTPCFLFDGGAFVCFRSQDGLLLRPLQESYVKAEPGEAPECSTPDKANIGGGGGGIRTPASTSKRKRRRRRRKGVPLVNGSMSVVHQLQVLTAHKCLEIEARVVRVSSREDGDARAVVLVDVYLPIAVWSGWQFPSSGALAASFFKHLSCDWEIRNSMLSFDWKDASYSHVDDKLIWSYTDCHVLGCEMHCCSSDSGNARLFDLHEIFKHLPSVVEEKVRSTRIEPEDQSLRRGIWDIPDNALTDMLTQLSPKDLARVSGTCRHLRSLSNSVMPYVNLKLFPHQEAAVEWMLKREQNAGTLAHPLCMQFSTEDGFSLYINIVTGEISTGMAPIIKDFRGGMFCDEPGLGKTVTALSLILKTYGALADPPHGVDVVWCMRDSDRKCGYYELSANNVTLSSSSSTCQRNMEQNVQITNLPGFYTKGTSQGKEQNVSFFISALKDPAILFNSETEKALSWLYNLSDSRLLLMETVGLLSPLMDYGTYSDRYANGYHKLFEAFGLVRKVERWTSRWYYPPNLDNLAFDLTALRIARTKLLDFKRLYLSGATLIVVPSNLVDHWKTQIEKHASRGQLRVYIWAGNNKPCANDLAWSYDVVIITFNQLSAEWGPCKRSVLMQIHWLRVMLDEGHRLGSSLGLPNKLQMAISLAASNRWILTGTPTLNTPNSQVAHLRPMLQFLHEEAYGQNETSWKVGIVRPFEAQMEEGRLRLLQLLQRTMICARKTDLKIIPSCIKKVTYLHFTKKHARSYNDLVATVRRNILVADWNDPSHVESLLNPKQWKFRSTTIRNVRLSCCVAGHIKVADAGQNIQKKMDILEKQGLDPLSQKYVLIKNCLLNGCVCSRCKDWCRLPVITPCRHLLCVDCVALDSMKCTSPGCDNHYEMQSPEISRRPENPNPKWPVPKDLIELQPSYNQDNWDPDWKSTSSSKVAYLVERLKVLQESNRKIGFCLDKTDDGKRFVNSQKSPSSVFTRQETATRPNDCKMLPEKVIIFSQFLEHINVIMKELTIAGIKYAEMYSPKHLSDKMKALRVFQQDPNCMALIMDGSAALGLDLSFVTHVFLMEPIWDRSMEEQVISRAHRLGATRPFFVETLAMRGTIEEQMLEFLQDASAGRRMLKQESSKLDHETSRGHRTPHDFAESSYLAELSFVRTNVKA